MEWNKFDPIDQLTVERYHQMRKIYSDKRIREIINEWGVDVVNKGYDIFTFNGMGIFEVSRIDDVEAFESDDDATEQAIKDGIKIIPVDELPETFGRRYLGWIDTPENRARIAELAEKYPNDRLV